MHWILLTGSLGMSSGMISSLTQIMPPLSRAWTLVSLIAIVYCAKMYVHPFYTHAIDISEHSTGVL
jgi:hypothetical protein